MDPAGRAKPEPGLRMSQQPLPPVIAIDGPSASGKGTVAQLAARHLLFHFLDSGALYRLVALAALDAGANLDDDPRISDIAMNLNITFSGRSIYLEGWEVSLAIRAERVGEAASRVATLPGVRRTLLQRQRAYRRPPGLVADGRDMGSVVFPDAVLKVYLTATPEERARRRYKQLMEKGLSANMAVLLQDIRERDARDSARAVAPLEKAPDAVHIDTTGMTVDAVVAEVLARFRAAQSAP
jgi:cytidylate kinase